VVREKEVGLRKKGRKEEGNTLNNYVTFLKMMYFM
jgi:hypothetical protein